MSTLLPLALLLLTRGIRDGRLWAWGALAITIGLAVLSPHPQLLQYLLLTCGAFALYLAFAEHPARGSFRAASRSRRLARSPRAPSCIGLLDRRRSVLAGSSSTSRGRRAPAGHDYATATSYSFPIEETLNTYWPQFSGILDNYWGRNFIHFHSDYFGVVVLMLVGAAFGQYANKSFRRFWVATGVVALLWAFGGYTPFFHLILAVVPGTIYFRAPSTIIYVTAFAVSVLAAIGMERVLASGVTPKYAIGVGDRRRSPSPCSCRSADTRRSSSAMISTFGDASQQGAIEYLSQKASANTGAAILGVWRSLLFVALGAGIIWAYLTNRLAGKATAAALVAVLVVDLWSIERMYWIFSPRASKLYATDPAIDAIKADMAKSGQRSASGPSR